MHLLTPCSHEEADSRMMLHVVHAAHKILVRTVDTDVVVLVAETLPAEDEVWLAFRTGKHFRYLAAHQIAVCLGPEKSLALPMFHALTGCDTVSAFVGHGKKTAWATWNSFSDLTAALLELAHAPTEIPERTMNVIERFVILMYDRTSTCTDVNKGRKKHLLCAENTANTCCFGAACQTSYLPRWTCLGTSSYSRPCASFSM